MINFGAWYFSGLGGMGGWVATIVIGVVALAWLFVDSARRHLPAGSSRLTAFASALILLGPPTVAKITNGWQTTLAPALAIAGVLGAVVLLGVTAVYSIRFAGLMGCVKGHKPFRASLRECPQCAHKTVQGLPGIKVDQPQGPDSKSGAGRKTSRGASKSDKPRSEGWLVDDEGSVYQINVGDTSIGRAPQNDIRLWEASASRLHAKISEQGGVFVIYDMGSVAGTWLNGQRVRRPEALISGDVLTFGTSTRMTFTTKPGDLK